MTRLIDADELNKKLLGRGFCNPKDDSEHGVNFGLQIAQQIIDAMPTVERPHGEWIPWGVKFPQVDQYILVTLNKDMLRGDDLNHPVVILRYSDGKDDWIHTIPNVITAWMPLPEPYKREGVEK